MFLGAKNRIAIISITAPLAADEITMDIMICLLRERLGDLDWTLASSRAADGGAVAVLKLTVQRPQDYALMPMVIRWAIGEGYNLSYSSGVAGGGEDEALRQAGDQQVGVSMDNELEFWRAVAQEQAWIGESSHAA